MCWNAPVSLALGAAGMTVAGVSAARGGSKDIAIPLAYFSLMELLQFASYGSIDQCALASNTALTTLSYVHVAFQPIFFNMLMMASVPGGVSRQMRRIAYGVSLAITALLLVKLVPAIPASLCAIGETLCGAQMCTVSGNWHLAWQVPLYDAPIPWDIFYYYAAGVFVLPLFYRAWLAVVVALASGPVLTYLIAQGNPNEWPAIWCFFSVALILVGMLPHSKRIMAGVRASLSGTVLSS